MASSTFYHGTKRSIGESFIRSQSVEFSKCGDPSNAGYSDLWLGDGFYLFEEPFFAFKWITQKKFGGSADFLLTALRKSHIILLATIECNKNRIFDLRFLEHKMLFDIVMARIMAGKIPKEFIPEGKIPEAVVINYLFTKMNYAEKYDMVCAAYVLNTSNYVPFKKTQQGFVWQIQYCVKMKQVIARLAEFDFSPYIDEYSSLWQTLFPEALPFGVSANSIYNIDGRSNSYGL